MEKIRFKAMLVEETGEKKYERKITDRTVDDLPEGDVLVKVAYSSLNYKDALSAIGNKGVTRNYPRTPGIDAAGPWKIDLDRLTTETTLEGLDEKIGLILKGKLRGRVVVRLNSVKK